jgi:hypothetical protein
MLVGFRPRLVFIVVALCFVGTGVAQSNQENEQVFVGEITDSFCAANGSHDELMKEMKSMRQDKKTCTVKCIELGAKLVLYVPDKHAVYKLDDTTRILPFAGETVRITGTLRKNLITVATIENVSKPLAAQGGAGATAKPAKAGR